MGNGLLADGFILHIVAAVNAIAVPAVFSAGKALAIQFQAFGILAVAVFASGGVAGKNR